MSDQDLDNNGAEPLKENTKRNNNRFALYSYHVTRISQKDSSENEGDNQNDTDDNFSLSVLVTNLEPNQETMLMTFLSKRLSRGMMPAGSKNGNVSSMDFCMEENSSTQAICYHSLLHKQSAVLSDSQSDDNSEYECISSSSSCTQQQYVVCLLTGFNVTLDFFRPELSSFSESALSLIDPTNDDLTSVKLHLERWYEISLEYICRCVQRLGQDTGILLQLALRGANLDVISDDDRAKEDFEMFFESCSVENLLSSQSVADSSLAEDRPPVTLIVNEDSYSFENNEDVYVTEYCKKWATTLSESDVDDPLHLKQIIEDFRLKTIQDINSLKRMIRQAENDHYALFRTYTFLVNSGYGNSLLQHAKHEEMTNENAGAVDVINVVEEFIKDCQVR